MQYTDSILYLYFYYYCYKTTTQIIGLIQLNYQLGIRKKVRKHKKK